MFQGFKHLPGDKILIHNEDKLEYIIIDEQNTRG
jgi:hypothetical protein